MGFALRGGFNSNDIAANLLIGRDALGQGGCLGHHQHVGKHDRKRLVTDDVAGAPHGVAKAERGHLAHETHAPWHRQVTTYIGQQVELALGLQRTLNLRISIEIVFNCALAATGDEHDMLNACSPRLFDHIGQDRSVNDVQHVLGRSLGSRQDPSPQARHRHHCLTNGFDHRAIPP